MNLTVYSKNKMATKMVDEFIIFNYIKAYTFGHSL
jgi:hypothetical protein